MVMPLKQPQQWCCRKCGWKDSHVMTSDVLLPQRACPKCGSETVLKAASVVDSTLSKLGKLFS